MPLDSTESIEREMLSVSLEEWHAALERIATLQAQVNKLREELRRYVAAQVEE